MEKHRYLCVNVIASNHVLNMSRHDLLRWINVSLNVEENKVESLCSGVVYCRLLNILFPGCVAVKRLKHGANQQHEFISNLKILQNAFMSVGCNKDVPIDRLIQGRYQDNFEFLQWFKRFYDANYGVECYRDTTKFQESQSASKLLKRNEPLPSGHFSKGNVQISATSVARPSQTVEHLSLPAKNKLKILKEKRDAKKEEISVLTKERDFYFEKLKRLEVICLEHSEAESGSKNQVGDLASRILAKLYENEEGFGVLEDAEEESY